MSTLIDKDLLADENTRSVIEKAFDNLTNKQSALLAKYANDPNVRGYVWFSFICANELKRLNAFSRDSVFIMNIQDIWEYYVDLPDEIKEAFSEHWDAVERMMTHIELNSAAAKYIDEVARYVGTRDSSIGFIHETLSLFGIIDAYYHPDEGGVMTENERRFILVKTCDAFRPLLRERRTGKLSLRDQVAIEVFEMVRYWGDDEFFDILENYPVGPIIDTEQIRHDINRVANSGLFNDEEVNAYKQLKMRDIAELIRINANFEYIDEAKDLYEYYGQLVKELGDEIEVAYDHRYIEAGEALKSAINKTNRHNHGKRRKD